MTNKHEVIQKCKVLFDEHGIACPKRFNKHLLTEGVQVAGFIKANKSKKQNAMKQIVARRYTSKIVLANTQRKTRVMIQKLFKEWNNVLVKNKKSSIAGLDQSKVKGIFSKLGYVHTFRWGKLDSPCEKAVKEKIYKTISSDEYGLVGPQMVQTKTGKRLMFLRNDKWIAQTDDIKMLKEFVLSKHFVEDK